MKYSKEIREFLNKCITSGEAKTFKEASELMCNKFNIKYNETIGRNVRRILSTANKKEKELEETNEFIVAKNRITAKDKQVYIISWAQNETPIHSRFFNNILAYSKDINASVHIIAGRYKNPTSVWTDRQKKGEWWDSAVVPYLDANRHKIHKYLHILSDVKIQPTASTPLSGMNGITGVESCILGHPRVHLRSLPVLDGYPNKLILTTGAVTVENYTDSKAGKKGEFHHQLGFTIVELYGDYFYIRQITADKDGDFCDLNNSYINGERKRIEKTDALILGDIHGKSLNEKAWRATVEMIYTLKPEVVVLHDVFDGLSINPHAKKDPYFTMELEQKGYSLGKEIEDLKRFVETLAKAVPKVVVVRSNHDDFFDRFLVDDWRASQNKMEFLHYANIKALGQAPKGIIPYIIDTEINRENIITLGDNDSYIVNKWELGLHGHIGSAGSRGTHIQFKNLNIKNITGHTHTPIREDGHLSVGTLTNKRLNYNKGMSSWMHANVVIYPNGQAQHLFIIDGRYTGKL